MLVCTPSPTSDQNAKPSNPTDTPLGPPKRKKNVRVRKSVIAENLLADGLSDIKVKSPKSHKTLSLMNSQVTLKVQVNSTPSPKDTTDQAPTNRQTKTDQSPFDSTNFNQSHQSSNKLEHSPLIDSYKYGSKFEASPLTNSHFIKSFETGINKNITNLKSKSNSQNVSVPSTPKLEMNKAFVLDTIRHMKTRSMTLKDAKKQEKIEDLLNSSTVQKSLIEKINDF